MEEIIIETYHDKYKQDIQNLILEIQQKEFGLNISIDNQLDLQNIPIYYQNANGNFWVATKNNNIIGTIALLDIGNNQVALRKMFVEKEYRGKEKGVAQKLLTHLLRWTANKNINEIFLGTTEKFLAAQRFYEKNNFIEIDKSELPKAFPIMTVDIKFYKCKIYN